MAWPRFGHGFAASPPARTISSSARYPDRVVATTARDPAGDARLATPAVADFLTVLAARLGDQFAWFVPADPGAPPARSQPEPCATGKRPAPRSRLPRRVGSPRHTARTRPSTVGDRTVEFYEVQSGSGDVARCARAWAEMIEADSGWPAARTADARRAGGCPAGRDRSTFRPQSRRGRSCVDWASTKPGGRPAFAISIDDVGVANEVLGFHAGDVLLDGARRARAALGRSDRDAWPPAVARATSRSGPTSPTTPTRSTRRIGCAQLIAEAVDVDGHAAYRDRRASGSRSTPAPDVGPEVLLASAVRCGAAARAAGGNRYELYDDEATSALLDRLRLGLELYGALLDRPTAHPLPAGVRSGVGIHRRSRGVAAVAASGARDAAAPKSSCPTPNRLTPSPRSSGG